MTKLYKLTDAHGRTYNNTQWGENVTHSGTGDGELCGPGFIHAYESALLAVLLNPIHANFQSPKLWAAEGEIVKNDNGLKCGCVSLTTIKELTLPEITKEMRSKFAILCAIQVYKSPDFLRWADNWLSGEDRSQAAAEAAERAAAWDAAEAAERATWAAEGIEYRLNLIHLAEEACNNVI